MTPPTKLEVHNVSHRIHEMTAAVTRDSIARRVGRMTGCMGNACEDAVSDCVVQELEKWTGQNAATYRGFYDPHYCCSTHRQSESF